VNNFGTEMSL